MKNILLATTALVASTGFVWAQEVVVSGSAEMGIFGADNGSENDEPLQFHTDIDVGFTMTGETDNGLAFGAAIDLDDAIEENDDDDEGAFNPAFQGGEEIFISGPFGTLTMGDTDGAFDWGMSEAIIGSSLQDDHEHVGYNGNAGLDGTYDGQIARYEYTFGDFGFAISGEIDDEDDPELEDDAGDPILGLGARYDTSLPFAGGLDIGFGAGIQTVADVDQDFFDEDDDVNDVFDFTVFGLSASTEVYGVEVVLNYSVLETDVNDDELDLDDAADDFGDGNHYGIALGYSFEALTVAMNYGEYDDWGLNAGDGEQDARGLGFIANYDLGGGAQLQAGVGFNDPDGEGDLFSGGDDDDDDDDEDAFVTYSFGIAMDF